MYERFYGLREKPFALIPDARFLYMTEQHENAYTLLEYAVLNQAGFVVITGEIGAGKTTLLRKMLDSAALVQGVRIGEVGFAHPGFGTIIHWVSEAFGLPLQANDNQAAQQLFSFLRQSIARGERLLLVFDEAQNLDVASLEQLRLLSNFNGNGVAGLQIILCGQPELRLRLSQPGLTQLTQRISADYHLRGLNTEQAVAYIGHRLVAAGGDAGLFDERAKRLAAYYSRGVPRLLNILCDMAMVYGYAAGQRVVDADLVKEVVEDRKRQQVIASTGRVSAEPVDPDIHLPATEPR